MIQVSPDGSETPPQAALDLHEGLSTPEGSKCRRTGHLWLFAGRTGELVKPRCKSPNLCEFDAKMAAIENSEMLALDACEGDPPQLVAILTTRAATTDTEPFYRGREKVVKALRRRWPALQYACLLEFTTGYGPRSGGQRRPHWNLLLKGVAVDDVDQVRELVARIWCQHVDAEPGVQYVEPIASAQALMRYVSQHFQKESQKPPADFTGQRFNCSRRYFTGCSRAQARERAKLSLARKRSIHRSLAAGISPHDAELVAELALRRFTKWELIGWAPGERPQVEISEARRFAHQRLMRDGRGGRGTDVGRTAGRDRSTGERSEPGPGPGRPPVPPPATPVGVFGARAP